MSNVEQQNGTTVNVFQNGVPSQNDESARSGQPPMQAQPQLGNGMPTYVQPPVGQYQQPQGQQQGTGAVVIPAQQLYNNQQQYANRQSYGMAYQPQQPGYDQPENFVKGVQICCGVCLLILIVIAAVVGSPIPVLAFLMAIIPGYVLYRIYFVPFKHTVIRDVAAKLFLFGMISVVPAALIEFGLQFMFGAGSSRVLMGFVNGFVIAGLTEEATKWVTIMLGTNNQQPTSKYAGALYGLMAAMGFALVENVGYVLTSGARGGIVGVLILGVVRALLAVPMHCLTGMYLGTMIFKRKMDRDPVTGKQKPWIDLLAPIFLHGLYDSILFSMQDPENPTLSFVALGLVALLMIITCVGFNMKFIPYAREGVDRFNPMVHGNGNNGVVAQQGNMGVNQPLMTESVQPVTAQPVLAQPQLAQPVQQQQYANNV